MDTAGDVGVRLDAELLHVVVLVGHRLIVKEGGELRVRHADGLQQERIGGDVDGLHVGEGRQHHLDFGGFEDAGVTLLVVVVHLDVGLGEEAEDLE